MSIEIRNKKSFRKRFINYIFFLIILSCLAYFLNFLFFSKRLLFISPLGKVNVNEEIIKDALKKNNILFSQIVVLQDFSYEIDISNNGKVRFSPAKNIDQQITSLQRIQKELTIEGKSFKNIDFRFSEPVISF